MKTCCMGAGETTRTSLNTHAAVKSTPTTTTTCNINHFLQDDALMERISSELERITYAQILSSLAMGSFVGHSTAAAAAASENANLSTSSSAAQQENEVRSLTTSHEGDNVHEYCSTTSAEQEKRHVHSYNGGLMSGAARGEKRRVKPTRKAQEAWNQALSNIVTATTAQTETKRKIGDKRRQNGTKRGAAGGGPNMANEALLLGPEWNDGSGHNLGGNVEDVKIGVPSGHKRTVKEQELANEDKAMVKRMLKEECDSSILTTKNARYRCDQCGKCFKTYYTYSIHIRMPNHTQETPFVCDICGKGFRLSSTLCRHKIIHTTNKPHQCQICSKTFNRSSTLKMHARTHSGRKQHVCAECGKGFHQKGNLRNHMFVHSGERPFHCESCGRLFNKKSNLKHHLKIHEINGQLACTVCKTTFPRNEELREHMEMMHCK